MPKRFVRRVLIIVASYHSLAAGGYNLTLVLGNRNWAGPSELAHNLGRQFVDQVARVT